MLGYVQHSVKFPIEFRRQHVDIYDPNKGDNVPMASVTLDRFVRWHYEYNRVRTKEQTTFKKYHGTNFVDDVVKMVRIHTREINFDHWVNHPPIYRAISKALNLKTEYFASPLNFNLCHANYFSEHTVDRLFGSKGNAWTHRWDASGVANPIYTVRDIKKTMAMAHKYTNLYENNGFVLTIPLWESKLEQYFHLFEHENVQPLAAFNEHSFAFHHPNTSINQRLFGTKPKRKSQWKVAIVLIRKRPLDEDELQKLNPFFSLLQELDFNTMPADDLEKFLTQDGVPPLEQDSYESIKMHAKQSKWKQNNLPLDIPQHSFVQLDVTCQRFGLDTTACLDEAVRQCEKTGVDTIRKNTLALTDTQMADLCKLCAHLKNCATVFELDKNSGCALFTCKQYGTDGLNKTFRDDDHYRNLGNTDEVRPTIIEHWKETFKTKQWERFGTWRGKDLPYCYAMPKHKDLKKWRPIVSYCVHPMRTVLQRAGRALTHMLQQLPREDHFTLFTTQEFVPSLQNYASKLKAMHMGFDRIQCIAGDIKQMYTELPHDFILEAIDWLIQTTKQRSRRNHVSVPRRGNKGTHMGRNHNTETWVSFNLDELSDIVQSDLENATFTQGCYTLNQNVGIPMGSPLSPALAIIMCAYCEFRYSTTNKSSQTAPTFGLRYVDDAFYMTAYI